MILTRSLTPPLLVTLLGFGLGCEGTQGALLNPVDLGNVQDAGSASDSGIADLGASDLASTDLGPTDLGPTDLGPTDLGSPDFGADASTPVDMGPQDGGVNGQQLTPSGAFYVVADTFDDGRYLLGWGTSASSIRVQTYRDSLVPTGNQGIMSTSPGLNRIDLARIGSNRYAIVHDAANASVGSGIRAQVIGTNGFHITDVFDVSPFANRHWHQGPQVAALGSGFIVAWKGQPKGVADADIYARPYDENGIALGERTVINTSTAGSQSAVDLATTSSGAIVLWDEGDLFARRIGAGGALGEEIAIGQGDSPVITALQGNGFAVGYLDQDALHIRRFDGANALVSTTTVAQTYRFDMGSSEQGVLGVVWVEASASAFVRVFDASGGPIGPAFPVNVGTFAERVAITVLPDSSVAVIWRDGNRSAYAARFSALGEPL